MPKSIEKKTAPILNKLDTDKAVAEFTEFLKEKGIEHFILLFHPVPGLTTSHLQEMSVKDALSALIAGFKQTVKLELEMHPDTPREYQAALLEMLEKFMQLIRETNEKISVIEPIPTA